MQEWRRPTNGGLERLDGRGNQTKLSPRLNCVQFVVANAISNSPQKKRERTHYAHARQKKFARPAPRDFASLWPILRTRPAALFVHTLYTLVHAITH